MGKNKSQLQRHWQFALGTTLGRLETLVWGFDSDIESNGHAFSGVPAPEELITIIDGFSGETDIMFQGTITQLNKMRQYLIEVLAPAYQDGLNSAQLRWHQASTEERAALAEFDFPDFRNDAKKQIPQDAKPSQANWFVEGYCRQWRVEWMEYYRQLFEAESGET